MDRVLFRTGVRGELIRTIQTALAALGFDPQGVDGIYGEDTHTAVEEFQRAKGLARPSGIDASTWHALVGTPVPDVRDRSLQLTAAFEGHGFTRAQGNFDGAGLTWGIIGFTLQGGELSRLILHLFERAPALVRRAFGEGTDELIAVMRSPIGDQIMWADAQSRGGSKAGLAEPWLSAFRRFGEIGEVQNAQLAFVERDYHQPALATARAFGLRSELGLALAFDVQVQNGGIGDLACADVAAALADRPDADERDLRVAIAHAVADHARRDFREDVRARKLTIASGEGKVHGARFLLRDWGLDEVAAEA